MGNSCTGLLKTHFEESEDEAMRAALIQMRCSEDGKENLEKAVTLVRQAAREGAQIICLPELFQHRYFPHTIDSRYFDLAEKIEDGSTPVLQKEAKELGVVIISSFFEKDFQGSYYNSAVVIDAEGLIIGRYRKNHIPLTGTLKEKFYFRPGDLGFPVFNTPFGKIGILICYDRYFPEGFRILSLQGATAVLIPSACAGDSKNIWDLVLRANAVFNLVFICAANRIGKEGSMEFYGKSIFVSPWGEVLKMGSEDREEIVICDLDESMLKSARERWPFFRDLRYKIYSALYIGGD